MGNQDLFRQRIKEHILERHIPREQDGHWLNHSQRFYHGLTLKAALEDKAEQLLEQLLKGRRRDYNELPKKRRDLSILLANLLHVGRYQPVAIPLDESNWKKRRGRIAGPYTPKLAHALHERSLIGIKRGNVGRYSRIWPERALLELFKTRTGEHDLDASLEYSPPDFIVLRDKEKKPIDFRDTPETVRIRHILRTNYHITKNASVKVENQTLSTALHAVFSIDWDSGGRLYTATRHGYQQLLRNERKIITINGEETTELDYSGLHPRMLYAKEGIQYDDDPYAAVDERPELRPYLKVLLLALLNASTETKAVSAGSNHVFEMCEKGDYSLKRLLRRLKTGPRDLMNQFKVAHNPIKEYFGERIGLQLMNADSKIMLDIIEYCNLRTIPVLTIHYSIIVTSRHRDELIEVMNETYKVHNKGFTCQIK